MFLLILNNIPYKYAKVVFFFIFYVIILLIQIILRLTKCLLLLKLKGLEIADVYALNIIGAL